MVLLLLKTHYIRLILRKSALANRVKVLYSYGAGTCLQGVLPNKGIMGTCGHPGYVFLDFHLKQGIDFIIFLVLNKVSFLGR